MFPKGLSSRKVFFNFLPILLIPFVVLGNIEESRHRIKRQVVFTKSSKYFFRFNGKLNSLNYTRIVAFGFGSVRMNWDLPHSIPRRHQFFKRDIHSDIENIPNEVAVHGLSCMLKHLCQYLSIFQSLDSCGFFCEIGKIITRESGVEGNFFKNIMRKCDHYDKVCPHHSPEAPAISYG